MNSVDSGSASTAPAFLGRAGRLAAVGWVVMFVAVGLALHDLANSNRPHELTKMPYAAALGAVGVVLCGFVVVALWRAWRARREVPFRASHLVTWSVAVSYVLLFVGYAAFLLLALVAGLRS